MSGRFAGRVAFVTGAARGQGRAIALAFAEQGADIIAVDICGAVAPDSPAAAPQDFADTVAAVEACGRQIVARHADIRDLGALEAALAEGVERFGRLDYVCANAGIAGMGLADTLSEAQWDTMIEVNLSGAWRTVRAAIPHLKRQKGGAIVFTASATGLKALPGVAHYSAAKHGVIGLMHALAAELGPHWIRVNAVCSTTVRTPLIEHEAHFKLFRPDLEHPTAADVEKAAARINALPVPWIEASDVSNAILWLCSDEARYVTGAALPVDAGFCIK
ncbi:mycofactocin-coupled SDR family oxidoreductase [Sphingosinicella sp. LY1275]|uniref:mycofactocin-coupled SDR family oxidoreductase n=1 Tax=Sphingosinicella sp. LY1275 TaxID=3095379 RepID=UPI002ADEF147|nr:mycofactocin-coupled SDR family oxidoreductase [Sphingosinicella sp. LY1275]MEA1015346.1 mycofactocin-coupled SDR family oxidoreductase [Sphingosinicella sp. LY1275]